MVVIPKFREAFKNPYSVAHDSDMEEYGGYWINLFYETYYGVDNIKAIPRDEGSAFSSIIKVILSFSSL